MPQQGAVQASCVWHSESDRDTKHRYKEPAKCHLDHHRKPDRDTTRRYEESAERQLDQLSTSWIIFWGGVCVDAPQKERKVRWCIIININVIKFRPSLTCLNVQRTASMQGPTFLYQLFSRWS